MDPQQTSCFVKKYPSTPVSYKLLASTLLLCLLLMSNCESETFPKTETLVEMFSFLNCVKALLKKANLEVLCCNVIFKIDILM